jgi:hypothetical protein
MGHPALHEDEHGFFESGRSRPAWICALGFIEANLGAQEVMGMAASGGLSDALAPGAVMP